VHDEERAAARSDGELLKLLPAFEHQQRIDASVEPRPDSHAACTVKNAPQRVVMVNC
jgi:hypothetical protein